ncbi:MAG: flagellar assembly protein FliH [Betaproteobacteria bacterium]|nr:flagellar assembly protein FliH [Betaproteobacteria bacterium]
MNAVDPAPPAEELEREKVERARAQAREAGRVEGYAEGMRQADADVRRFREVLGHLTTLAEDLEQGIANDVLSLSLELAKQIVRQSLRAKPEIVLSLIREATRSFPELGESRRLILHPDDASIVRALAASDPADELGPWTIIEDPQVERGGCKFQNASTEIDATLETRWRRVVASLGRDDAWLDLNL